MKNKKLRYSVIFLLLLINGLLYGIQNITMDLELDDREEFPHINSDENDYIFEWNTTLGTIYEDRAIGVAIDSNDDVYVSGFQDISGSNTNRDMVLVKYNPSGEQQWVRYWGGVNDDIPLDILIDSSDNIYIAGLTHSFGDADGDAVVIKYNTTGHQQWNFTWGGSQYDFFESIGIDSSNNFYIGGRSDSFGDIDGDAVLVKFDENWIEQWNKTWGGSDTDEANYLHVDKNDDIYISGLSDSLGSSAFLNKYNTSGDLQWSQNWGGPSRALGIATDSLDNVYIVCRTFAHPAGSGKGAIVKYNSTGTYQWEEVWGVNGVYNNYMYRIIIDSNDELYVSGLTYSYGIPNNNDAILFNYDTDGNQNWYKTWAEYEWDLAFDLCMDSQANIYLAGDTISYSVGQKDMLVLKYNYTGSSSEINIVTPENKTYTEPMSGYYPATYGFENDEDGNNPKEWEVVENGGTIDIIDSLGGHNRILEIDKNGISNYPTARNPISIGQVSGTVEFWMRSNDVTESCLVTINNHTDGTGFTFGINNDHFVWIEGSPGTTHNIVSCVDNTWYHVRADFECSLGAY